VRVGLRGARASIFCALATIAHNRAALMVVCDGNVANRVTSRIMFVVVATVGGRHRRSDERRQSSSDDE